MSSDCLPNNTLTSLPSITKVFRILPGTQHLSYLNSEWRGRGPQWGCGHPGATAHLASAALGGPQGPTRVGVPPEWVSRPCAELCSDPRRVSLAAGQPRAGCGFSALGAAAPAARRPPGLGCGAVTCPWPSSGASSGGNVCLPALERSPPHQPAPSPPAGPRMGEMGRSPQLHAAPSASSACSSLAAAASGWLAWPPRPWASERWPSGVSASAAGLGHLPGHSLHPGGGGRRPHCDWGSGLLCHLQGRGTCYICTASFPLLTLLEIIAGVYVYSAAERRAQEKPEGHRDQGLPPAVPGGREQRRGQVAAGVPLLWQQQLAGLAGQ